MKPARSLVAYWAATLIVSVTAVAAGAMDLAHAQPLYGILLHLGYPSYFATILGAWKIAGAVVLVVPRRALLKEWAYAGMVIDYSSAIFSHAATGDAAATLIGPLVSVAALVASWWLRPPDRRLRE